MIFPLNSCIRVFANVYACNKVSIRVLEKIGSRK